MRDLHDLTGTYDPRTGTILLDAEADPRDIAAALLEGLDALAADPDGAPHARPRLRVVRDGTG